MIDSSVKLFGGDTSLADILDMEIEEFREAVEVRSEQRRKSLERYNKTGEKDLYIGQDESNEQMMQLMATMLGRFDHVQGLNPVKPNGANMSRDPREGLSQKEFLQQLKEERGTTGQ